MRFSMCALGALALLSLGASQRPVPVPTPAPQPTSALRPRELAVIPPSPGGATVDTRTKTIGGLRVTGAVRQAGSSQPAGQAPVVIDPPRPVRIRVQAATHLAEKCQPVS